MIIDIPKTCEKRDGTRLPRYADEDIDNKLDESREQFKHRKKKRVPRVKRRIAVPYRITLDPNEKDIRVTKTNWMGRRERDPRSKRSRINGVLK